MNNLYNTKYYILGSTIKPNPAIVKYWADLSSNPNGGDLKYFNGKEWVLVNNQATVDISKIEEDITNLKNSKVDKVSGKQLSTNDFTNELKSKLDSLENYDDSTITNSLNSKVDKVEGKQLSTNDYTTEEKNKLSGIQANANNYTLPAASTTALGGVKKLAAIEDLAGEADINAVIATVNELLAGLRTAGILTT